LSSLRVRDQALHPYKTTGKIIVLNILILRPWHRWEDNTEMDIEEIGPKVVD
jgi:hypothetical protein